GATARASALVNSRFRGRSRPVGRTWAASRPLPQPAAGQQPTEQPGQTPALLLFTLTGGRFGAPRVGAGNAGLFGRCHASPPLVRKCRSRKAWCRGAAVQLYQARVGGMGSGTSA